jgi:hypothetical protein
MAVPIPPPIYAGLNQRKSGNGIDTVSGYFRLVKGNMYTHIVKGKNNDRGLLIGNNHGRINGWTKQAFGKVIEIL